MLQLKVEVEKARERESALARERAELHDVLIMAREQQHAAPGPRLSTSGDTEKLEKQLQEEKLKTQGINKLSEMMMHKVLMEELSFRGWPSRSSACGAAGSMRGTAGQRPR